MWSSTILSVAILLAAIALIASHIRHWRRVEQSDSEGLEYDFRRRQVRRRVQTSGLVAVLAVGLLVSPLMNRNVWLFTFYCLTMLGLVTWVAVLAGVDLFATRQHYDRVRDIYLAEEAKLKAELRRIRASKGNGKAEDDVS